MFTVEGCPLCGAEKPDNKAWGKVTINQKLDKYVKEVPCRNRVEGCPFIFNIDLTDEMSREFHAG